MSADDVPPVPPVPPARPLPSAFTDAQLSAWDLAHEGLILRNTVYRDVAVCLLHEETTRRIMALFDRADVSNALLDRLTCEPASVQP